MHRSWQIIIVCLRKAAHGQWCVLAVSACMHGFISNVCAHTCAVFCPHSSSHLEIAIPVHIWWPCSCEMLVLGFSHRSLSTYFVVMCCCIMAQLCNRLHSIFSLFFFFTQPCAFWIYPWRRTHTYWLLHFALKYTLSAPYASHLQWCLQSLASAHNIRMNPLGQVSQHSENLFGLYTQSTNLSRRLLWYLIWLNTIYFYTVSKWGFLWYPSCLCFGLRLEPCYFHYYGFCVYLNIC